MPKHDGLVFSASASDAALALVNVHVARLAADEGFVHFDFTANLLPKSSCIARRIRCSMNHAVFWVTFRSRASSQLLMPFLQLVSSHRAVSHLSRPIAESSREFRP